MKMIYAIIGSLLTLHLVTPVSASTKVKIATVPNEFTPYAGPGLPEPVFMSGYYFEVNEQNNRARVVVDYSYRNQVVFAGDDAHGPEPTYAQIPGLIYDPSAHAVVYERNGQKTVCAIAQESRGRFGRRLKLKATGKCTITAIETEHSEDDGWKIRRFRAIDVYFEAQ